MQTAERDLEQEPRVSVKWCPTLKSPLRTKPRTGRASAQRTPGVGEGDSNRERPCTISSRDLLTFNFRLLLIAMAELLLPSSAISLSPLRSFDRHDLYVPRARTAMAQTRAFAIIGLSLWNQLLPSTRSTLLTGEPSASFRSLIRLPFSLWVSRTGSASDWCALQEALYKCIDTIQYNPPKPRSCPKRQCWQ